MTLAEFYTQLKSDLKNLENIYKGFVITELSLPNFSKNKNGVYYNSIYVDALNNNLSVKLLINLNILEAAIKDGHNINENVSVDVTIDSISLDSKGVVLIKISKIVESGISEQELFIKNLTVYCKENNLFNRERKEYPSMVKRIALISTNNTNTLDDIMKNLDYTKETSSFKVPSTSQAIAEQIKLCNNEDYDFILLYRGGHEDKSMNIYSDIPVLNAINESNIHIGVALGHEIDTPFVYKIADSTYSTPTNFAQVINKYNQDVVNSFNTTVFWIKENMDSIKEKLNTNLQLNMERILNHSNRCIHSYELKLENKYSNIESKHLLLLSKIEDNLKNKANSIKNTSNDLIYKNSQKKNKKTKIILIATLVIAISIILYLVMR